MNATLDEISDAFLAKLSSTFQDIEVDDYPDDPENYQLAHPKGAVLLTLHDRKFEPPGNTDGTGQWNSPVFQITFLSRSLKKDKKNSNIYDMLDLSRENVKEVEVNHHCAYILQEFFFKVAKGGVWMYIQLWSITDYFE